MIRFIGRRSRLDNYKWDIDKKGSVHQYWFHSEFVVTTKSNREKVQRCGFMNNKCQSYNQTWGLIIDIKD